MGNSSILQSLMDEAVYDSPVGLLRICASTTGVTRIDFSNKIEEELLPSDRNCIENPFLESVFNELDAYFEGQLERFDTPLDIQGTDFQKKTWSQLLEIPKGMTATYGEIAEGIGNRNASRAVGLANNRNPIPIVVPCHRVIGRDGKMIGFGGEIWRKQWLLQHEGAILA